MSIEAWVATFLIQARLFNWVIFNPNTIFNSQSRCELILILDKAVFTFLSILKRATQKFLL